MSGQDNLDIGKVIGLIMENPELVEQISSLAKQIPASKDETEEEIEIKSDTSQENTDTVTTNLPTYPAPQAKTNRAQLLCALKPYVSKDRARAIDSMISIADILDMMKGR